MTRKAQKRMLPALALVVHGLAVSGGVFAAQSSALPPMSNPSTLRTPVPTGLSRTIAKTISPGTAGSARAIATRGLHADPYVDAARKIGVPLGLLVAVAGAESGWHPWALNVGGREYYCASRQEASMRLASASDADIGLMQVNFSFWGARLGYSKEQLLDPAINLLAGAEILKMALDRKGDFWNRAGIYHSLDSREQLKWNKAVYKHYQEYLKGGIGGYGNR